MGYITGPRKSSTKHLSEFLQTVDWSCIRRRINLCYKICFHVTCVMCAAVDSAERCGSLVDDVSVDGCSATDQCVHLWLLAVLPLHCLNDVPCSRVQRSIQVSMHNVCLCSHGSQLKLMFFYL